MCAMMISTRPVFSHRAARADASVIAVRFVAKITRFTALLPHIGVKFVKIRAGKK